MIIGADVKVFQEEKSLKIETSSENKTFKSPPLRETTHRVFIRQSMTIIPDSITSPTNIVVGHFLETNSDITQDQHV